MKFHTPVVQTRYTSPLGPIILAASGKGLAGLWFEGQRHLPPELLARAPAASCVEGVALPVAPGHWAVLAAGGSSRRTATWPSDPEHPILKLAMQQLDDYFAGRRARFEVPLDLSHGTAFQQSVWQALLTIAQGDTASYGEVSARIGKPSAVRAVGAAVGRNPVSIIVPCHRVMGAGGALTGYAGGLDRKAALLKLEGALGLDGDYRWLRGKAAQLRLDPALEEARP
ncbi:methylated-DNA--[protein]-cysteine S-methyltransferase [Polaromonas sp.]|uniref:methylated-DNA--[protein]-cysteine S-methyltransferase n=1 Tax=Polaromonas sp. TaxID=1869339 RepID=UPI00286D46A7|nr:methylated-DNA--[protein]-cysteine S-methyltransferase [Polaromonas sp.]